MKVRISLNLPSIFFDVCLGGLSRLINNTLQLSKVVLCEASEAQLHGKQVEGIHKCMDLGMVGLGPAAHVHAARRTALHHADLLKAVKSVPHWRPAHLKTFRQIFFAEPLVGDEFRFPYAVKDLEDNPVSESTINRFRSESGRFVKHV